MTQGVPDLSRYVALDCEASGLEPRELTFPVSVGVSFSDLTTRHWLIRPAKEWLNWPWDPAAEAIHGISRDMLLAEGLPVEQVAAELADVVAGRTCVSDSDRDIGWIRTLYRATGQHGAPFPHQEWYDVLERIAKTKVSGPIAGLALIDDAVNGARRRYPPTHKADEDARTVMATLRLIAGIDT
ncbi:hypothetical protein [Roseomonas genomospecies 6]|uniref:Exonuclease domain-containing protein n=1 Tax=Roseomonas genomospecies 6 TaxID=214106 RepID=A0A9W7KQR1_9PROT|nr:hypothetical protein [Roseomonas genomospecies 6]KAA0677683.1 hypothetical protein DS843_22860 [Roseomonas genomospecies 6]